MLKKKKRPIETDEENPKDPRRLAPTMPFILSYPHVFKPSSMKGGDSKLQYSITMLIPKDTDITPFKKAIFAAKKAKWGKDKDEWPDNIQSPIKDGDDPENADKEGYAGHYAIKASTNADIFEDGDHPEVLGPDKEPITKASELYPGCRARACIFANGWNFGKKNGVHFILDSVQKIGEGKSFGGRKPASQVFTAVEPEDGEAYEESDEEDNDEDYT